MTTPMPAEPANDTVSIRAAVGFVGVLTAVLIGCATWLTATGADSTVPWSFVGVGLGALATLATTRLGGSRPQ